MAFDMAPVIFATDFPKLVSAPLEKPNVLVPRAEEKQKYEEGWSIGKEWVESLRGGEDSFKSLKMQATPIDRVKRFFGIKLGTKDVIKMADDIYMHLPDKFQVDADFNESKKTEKAGRFAVPLAQVRLSSSEYTPLRSACILVKLSETGLAPEYDKLSSLTQIQKRTFLARIAQNQKIMADMLIKNPDEQKKTYGQTMLDEAKEMSEKALQTVSENVEK